MTGVVGGVAAVSDAPSDCVHAHTASVSTASLMNRMVLGSWGEAGRLKGRVRAKAKSLFYNGLGLRGVWGIALNVAECEKILDMTTIAMYSIAMSTKRSSKLQHELRQRRAFASDAQEAAVGMMRTTDVLRRYIAGVIEPSGVTMQQYNVLRILRGVHPDSLPTLEIGERLIEKMPGVTRLLDRLEEKGLVRRERDMQDRRLVNCWITRDGLALLAALDQPVLEADELFMKRLSKKDVRTLIELLDRVRSFADEQLK
jgi:DNA-binding MarR family transcriptional regulator